MRQSFVQATSDLLDQQTDLALVLADISVGLFRDSGASLRHPERVINVGIREQAMLGVAGGLALEGFRPIVHTYAPFLVERPFEQLKLDLSHQGVAAVLVSIGASFDAASEGRTHQAPGDVALVKTLPNWTIYIPGHPDEAELLLRHAAATSNNVYLRLSESRNAEAEAIEPGQLKVARRGRPGAPTLVAVGPMLDPVMTAVEGIDTTVLYCTTVHPLDRETLRAHSSGTEVIVVEPCLEGTSTAEVVSALDDSPRRILAIGAKAIEHRHYGTPEQHQEAHGLDQASLATRIRAFIDG